jgi:RNA polymerase subunit RPABC4/transcription elongation factor Spt4
MAEYIEREETCKKCVRYGMGETLCADCVVKVAPAADVSPVVHGRWLQPKSGECFCSECKTLGSPQWKRCPVCEAKMTTE